MQDKIAPSSPHLSEAEKLEIGSLLFAGLPLPLQYKERLFPSVPPGEDGFADYGKTCSSTGCGDESTAADHAGACFRVCEYVPGQREGAGKSDTGAGTGALVAGLPAGGWNNLLIHGDNRDVLRSVANGQLHEAVSWAGGIQLIYADPPFAVGSDFMIDLAVGGIGDKPARTFSSLAFTDSWGEGEDSFAAMFFARIQLMHAALAEDGSIYLHCDRRAAPLARLFMDHVFGPERMLGEIIWHYTGGGRAKRYFSRKHDIILHYAKSGNWTFNLDAVRVPYKESSGYARSGIVSAAGKRYSPHPKGTPVDDVWPISIVNPMGHERLSYPTQKPEALLARIIEASSNPGDLVADFFCGSGTTLAVAERLGRKWLGADKGAFSIHETRKRLLSMRPAYASPVGAEPAAQAVGTQAHGAQEAVTSFRGSPFAILEYPSLKGVQADGEIVLDGIQTSLPSLILKARLTPMGNGFSAELTDCAPAIGGITPRMRPLTTAWPEWIDYWSVDYDYSPGLFQSRWQSFRSRRDRGLALQSPEFPFPEDLRGKVVSFRVAVLVVDIFSRAHLLELDTAAFFPFSSHVDGD